MELIHEGAWTPHLPNPEAPPMDFRFLAPLSDGTLADVTVGAITLRAAFEKFTTTTRPHGWYAVWCGLRLAGHVRVDEEGAELVDLKTEPPRQQSLACGD